MRKNLFLALLALTCSWNAAQADEGMWMLSNVNKKSMKVMNDLGLELNKKQLYNPKGASLKDAVVSMGGYCSGVIVSNQGLVFTNHHCGFGEIQKLATPQNDILKNGFVAHTQAEELPATGLYMRVLQRTEDVTKRVHKALEKAYKQKAGEMAKLGENGREKIRGGLIDSICMAVTNEYSKKYPKLVCEVDPYFTQNAFYVSFYKQYDDVRLVFAPPQSLGKFGGETDNWMWPRQTCDFSVFRIYADANNEPAAYSPNNKPLKPAHYAPVSLQGFDKGDYCMTVGYPGSTSRYLSSFGINERMNAANQARIDMRGVKLDIWKRWMASSPVIRLQYASKYAQSSNYWKNSIGMNKAIKELKVVEDKKKKESLIEQWANKSGRTRAEYGNMMSELQSAYYNRQDKVKAIDYMNEGLLAGADILRLAYFYQLTADMGGTKYKTRLENEYKNWNKDVDKETFTALIKAFAQKINKQYHPSFYNDIEKNYGGSVEKYVETLYAQSFVANPNSLNEDISKEKIENDMAMQCLKSVMEKGGELSNSIMDENLKVSRNERLLCRAILDMESDSPHYSDANSTMRFSYGIINDYTSATGHHDYYTTMPSLLKKVAMSDQIDEYKVEHEVKTLFENADFGPYKDKRTGEMQLCFLSTNDITGGNSGSPMFDGKGQLIGLAFDGNWDAMSGDICFNHELQRCIGVDIRYVMYIIDRWGKASRLVKEINAQ